MILTHSESRMAKAGATLGLLLVGVIMALYLAGYFFVWKLHNPDFPPFRTMPWTWLQYWSYYGDQPYTRKWLTITIGRFQASCRLDG